MILNRRSWGVGWRPWAALTEWHQAGGLGQVTMGDYRDVYRCENYLTVHSRFGPYSSNENVK